MSSIEELKLRRDKIEHYVDRIKEHKFLGLERLDTDIKAKKIGASLRIDVLALALARNYIDVEDIAAKHAPAVSEKYLKEAPWRERDTAAIRGTDVHDLAERMSQGEILDVPEHLKDHIVSWRNFVDDWQMQFIDTEFTVFSYTHGYAGTADFLAYSGIHPEWGVILGDYKTSESGIWPDIALQLAAIRYADFVARCRTCPHPEGVHPMGDLVEDTTVLDRINSFVGVQITDKGYKVVPVNVTEHTFNVFRAGVIVSGWKNVGERWALEDAEFVENKRENNAA